MSRVVLVGDHAALADAFAAAGAVVETVAAGADATQLTAAAIADAELLVLTTMADATTAIVARELHPQLRVVAYSGESLPPVATTQVDLAVDPALISPDAFVAAWADEA
jgi:alanine racemase